MTGKPASEAVAPILVTALDGSSASDNGELIKVGLNVGEGAHVNLILPTDRAADLIGLLGTAIGAAGQTRTGNPNVRYIYPAQSWEIAPQQDTRLLTFAFRLAGGAEMCFQFDRTEAQHLFEALGVILGVSETPSIPESQKH